MGIRWSDSEVLALAWGAAVVLCSATIVLRWIARRWKWRDRARLADEPRCGRCGYIIRRGSSAVCPECGVDLRAVGVVTPETGPAVRAGPWYVLAALVAMPVGFKLGVGVEERQPFGWSYVTTRWVYFKPEPRAVVYAGLPQHVFVQASGWGRYFNRRPKLVLVYAYPSPLGADRTQGMMIEAQGPTFRRSDRRADEPNPDSPFDRAALESLVTDAAPDASPVQRAGMAAELEVHVRELLDGDLPSVDRMTDDGVPRETLIYTLRDRPRIVVRVTSAALVTGGALWAVRLGTARLRLRRRAGWQRAVAGLRLVDLAETREAG